MYGVAHARVFNLLLGYLCTFDTVIETTTRNMLTNIGHSV